MGIKYYVVWYFIFLLRAIRKLPSSIFEIIKKSFEKNEKINMICRKLTWKTLDNWQYDKLLPHRAVPTKKNNQLVLDLGRLYINNFDTGIERRIFKYIEEFEKIESSFPFSLRVAYFDKEKNKFFYAGNFLRHYFPQSVYADDVSEIKFNNGDVVLISSLYGYVSKTLEFLSKIDNIKTSIIVDDIIPITHKKLLHNQNSKRYERDLFKALCLSNKIISVSRSAMEEIIAFAKMHGINSKCEFDYCYNGADFTGLITIDSTNLFPNNFIILSVGTIEKRKGYVFSKKVLEFLVNNLGIADVKLIIVGRNLGDNKTYKDLTSSHLYKKNLIIIENCSDQQLLRLYKRADLLFNASYGEGFGLPLIECQKYTDYKLPMLVRALPVFKEICADAAEYFYSDDVNEVSIQLATLINKIKDKNYYIDKSKMMVPFSWSKNALEITKKIIGDEDED